MTSGQPVVRVRRLGPDDWAVWRDVRLAMLLDSPGAFSTTYEQAVTFDQEAWRSRITMADYWVAARGTTSLGAVGLSDRFDGEGPGDTALVSLWVDPAARGQGVGRLLVGAAVERARELAKQRVLLDVVDTSPAARRLYESLGFRLTGTTAPYPHDDAVTELQMALPL